MEQTYISVFQDTDGKTIEFERWRYKRLDTCINALIKLYRRLYTCQFIKEDLAKASKVVTYKTNYEIRPDNIVSEIDIAVFIK